MNEDLLNAIITQAVQVGRADERHAVACADLQEDEAELRQLVAHVVFADTVVN